MADTKSLRSWISEGDPEVCRPCLLAPLAAWYTDALIRAGRAADAQELKRKLSVSKITAEQVAETLDGVEQKACSLSSNGDSLCKRLGELKETLFVNAEALG